MVSYTTWSKTMPFIIIYSASKCVSHLVYMLVNPRNILQDTLFWSQNISFQSEMKVKTGQDLNPYLTNGFYHHYHLDESICIFRGVRSDFNFLSHFSIKFLCANRIAPDGAVLFAYVP